MVKGRAQHFATHSLQIGENLVRSHFADQQEKCGVSCLQARRDVLHETIVYPDIGERAAKSAGRGSDRRSEKWHQEDEANERTPEGAAGSTCCRRMKQLVQFDPTVRLLYRDNGIAELDKIVLLHVEQFLPNFLRLLLRRKLDDDEVTHGVLLCSFRFIDLLVGATAEHRAASWTADWTERQHVLSSTGRRPQIKMMAPIRIMIGAPISHQDPTTR